jgi:hypothetical protein
VGDFGGMMAKVAIEGWHDPRNPRPVSLFDTIRRHAELSLPAAKKLLDVFAEHGQVVVDILIVDHVQAFVKEARSFGAVVRVLEDEG